MKLLYLSYENFIDTERNHDVMYLNVDSMETGNWRDEILAFEPDFLLEREFNDGRAEYSKVVNFVKDHFPECKTAVWLIDTHVSHSRHIEYAKLFDYVFLAISTYVDEFKESVNVNTFWLPVCYPYPKDSINRNYRPINRDIVFVGNWERIKQWFPERAEYVEFLTNHYKDKFYAVTDYDNMKTIIKEAKVSFNYCIKDDMNFRVFETLGLGTELVTNDVTDLHNIKGLTDFINIYRDKQDLVRIIDSILNNESTINNLQAQDWVQQNHTLYNRYKSLLKMILSGKQELF